MCNALNCTIHVTDSNPNSHNGTIIYTVYLRQRPRVIFLGYINSLLYVSTLQDDITCQQNTNSIKLLERKLTMTEKQKEERPGKMRGIERSRRANESIDSRKVRSSKNERT